MTETNYTEIAFDREDAVGILTLNNAGKVNALSRQMIGEIIDLLDRVMADETLKVLILKAAGKATFVPVITWAEMIDTGVKEYKFIFDQCTRMMMRLHEIPQVVIAQVQGIATAAGCQLAAWCDLVVAEEGARFSTPGVKIGLFCTTPMVAITRAIGRKGRHGDARHRSGVSGRRGKRFRPGSTVSFRWKNWKRPPATWPVRSPRPVVLPSPSANRGCMPRLT